MSVCVFVVHMCGVCVCMFACMCVCVCMCVFVCVCACLALTLPGSKTSAFLIVRPFDRLRRTSAD